MKKRSIRILLFLALAAAAGIRLLYRPATWSSEESGIQTYISQTDADKDGIDDQTDILMNAREYIGTRPKYKSAYYAGGYPDDGYGTCVDVVGYALKHAGYDLMNLVEKDIEEHPEDYSVDIPDANIDFRRVRNLKVYFAHTAISLSTDPNQVDQWQGGDIVIFRDHIGIVSDRRNRQGIPLVLHHSGKLQIHYEEDILGHREDITGHYRIS